MITEKLRHVDVNDKINIQRVLMLGSRYETIIGRPLVPGAFVTAAVEVRGKTIVQYPRAAQFVPHTCCKALYIHCGLVHTAWRHGRGADMLFVHWQGCFLASHAAGEVFKCGCI